MNRRNYLSVLGTGALAGCLGAGTDTTQSGDSPSPTETMTTKEQSISLQAGADPAGPIEVAGLARLTGVQWDPTRETAAGTGAVVGTVKNVGDDVLGRQRNRLTLFDDAGDVVGTTAESLEFVRSGTTYRFVLPLVGDNPEAVARFRLDARVWSRSVVSVNRGQFSVDDGFVQFEDGSHGVRGTVTNETDGAIFRALPHVNFYDGDELLAYGTDGVTDLAAGESATWRVRFPGDAPDDVGDHQVVVVYQQ